LISVVESPRRCSAFEYIVQVATRYKHLTVCHTLFWCLFAPLMSEGVEWPNRHARSRFTLEFDHSERIVAAHLRTEASWGHSSMCEVCAKIPGPQKGHKVRSVVTWSLGLVAWRICHTWCRILGDREAIVRLCQILCHESPSAAGVLFQRAGVTY